MKRLDVVPLQVFIEATIAEVTLNDDLRYGLQWFFRSGNNEFLLTNLRVPAISAVFPGFSYLFQTGDTQVLLDALREITDVKVLSAPQIMVLNNQVTNLEVGDEMLVITRSAVSVIDPEAPIVNDVKLRQTGVVLSVRPRVNEGGLVTMDVGQEVSDVVQTTTSGIKIRPPYSNDDSTVRWPFSPVGRWRWGVLFVTAEKRPYRAFP